MKLSIALLTRRLQAYIRLAKLAAIRKISIRPVELAAILIGIKPVELATVQISVKPVKLVAV